LYGSCKELVKNSQTGNLTGSPALDNDMDPLENNHKQRRYLILAIVVVSGILIALLLLRRGKGGGDQYRTEPASQGDITATVSSTGTLSAVTTVQVGSQVSGIISKLYADFNSQVKKGQLLAELDPTTFLQTVEQRQADVTKSQVELANVQVTYARQKRLAAAGLIAQADLDAAKAAYDSARAQLAQSQAALQQAKTNLNYTKIYSPIDGQVVARQYDIGQTVAASFQAPTLFTIAQDLTKMQLTADIDQSDIGRIKVGEPVRFTVDAYPDQQFRGAISQVRLNATVNQNVITYPVIIGVANPDLKLRPSMTADVTIQVATAQAVLRVPNAALRFRPQTAEGQGTQGTGGQRQGGQGQARSGGPGGGAGFSAGGGAARRQRQPGQTVYVLAKEGDKKGELQRVRLQTGITDGHYTQVTRVLSGELKPGDPVITGLATLTAPQTSGSTTSGRGGRSPLGRF
jgi:HlyD family secretion protein